MAATIGKASLVTSWAGTVNAALLANFSPMKFSILMNGQEIDITEYAASLVPRTHQSGLRDWEVVMEGFNAAAVSGNVGNVSGTDYAVALNNWNMTIGCAAVPVTNWTSLSAGWQTFLPGLQEWSGSYGGFVDGTTAIPAVMEYATSADASALFTISSGNTLGGTIRTTRVSIDSEVSAANTMSASFRGIGHLTTTGSDALLDANTGTMVDFVAGELVLTAATGRTYTGDAFPVGISVTSRLGDATRMTVRARGTGALTIA